MVPDGAPVIDRTLESLRVHEIAGAVLLAIRPAGDDAFVFDPPLDRTIEAGMTLILMVDAEGRERLATHVRVSG